MYYYTIFNILGVCPFLVSSFINPSPVDVSIGETAKKCREATDKADCYAKGCYYDCMDNVCIPISASCRVGASDLCFPNCQDKSTCEAVPTNECQYNDGGGSCTSMMEGPASLRNNQDCPLLDFLISSYCSSPFPERDPVYEFGPDESGPCSVICKITPCCEYECDIDRPTLAQICAKPKSQSHECCKPPTTTTTPKPTTTSTTTGKPTTTTTDSSISTSTTDSSISSTTSDSSISTTTIDSLISTTTTDSSISTTTTTETPTTPDPKLDKKCELLTFYPLLCRKTPQCYFDCNMKKCVNKMRVQSQCLNSCLQYCNDPCGCKSNTVGGLCEYNVITSRCVPRKHECSTLYYQPWECVHAGDYHAYQGMVCYNAADFGNCKIAKNVLSVNFNGKAYTDIRGVLYQSGDTVPYEDVYNTRLSYFIYNPLLHPDSELWQGFYVGKSNRPERRQCLRYTVPLEDDGVYQLTIKLQEPQARKIEKRMFNIEVADQVVISNIDMYALAGAKQYALTLSVSFRVTSSGSQGMKDVAITGHPSVSVYNDLKIGFCLGDCRFDDRFDFNIGKYVVGAFSVVLLG